MEATMRLTAVLVTLMLVGGPLSAAKAPKAAARKIGHSEQTERLIRRLTAQMGPVDKAALAEALSERYLTPISTIEELQGQKRSAGEMTLLLTIAQMLSKRDKVHFATTADALFEVQRLRRDGKSWAAVARTAGLRMDDILQTARRAPRDIRVGAQTASR
jgi:hypothetical protein